MIESLRLKNNEPDGRNSRKYDHVRSREVIVKNWRKGERDCKMMRELRENICIIIILTRNFFLDLMIFS